MPDPQHAAGAECPRRRVLPRWQIRCTRSTRSADNMSGPRPAFRRRPPGTRAPTVLEPELAAAMQSEMAITSLRGAEIEDGGEMHRWNLPPVFEVASVDAELLEQRSR